LKVRKRRNRRDAKFARNGDLNRTGFDWIDLPNAGRGNASLFDTSVNFRLGHLQTFETRGVVTSPVIVVDRVDVPTVTVQPNQSPLTTAIDDPELTDSSQRFDRFRTTNFRSPQIRDVKFDPWLVFFHPCRH
jgi:hypothetical protein